MKKPTLKQKKAAERIVENHGNIYKSMIEAGYSPNTAKNPKNLTESKSWEQLLDEIPDDLLKQKILEGLEAEKPIGASILVNKDGNVIKADDEGAISVPDQPTRHKFIDTALKLKDKYPAEKRKIQGDAENPLSLEIVITEDKKADE